MITASVDRAIVEILADAATPLGTGFLVSADGLILTAKHVVGARTNVLIRFAGGNPAPATLVEIGGGDWAIVRLNQPVPGGFAPIPVGRIGNVAKEVIWHSVGFAKIRGGRRGGFHGIVQRVDPQLELFCEELVNKSYDDARGLSGGPCVVDGEAVGIIVDVFYKNDGGIVTGEVNAIPFERIVPTKVALALGPGPELPWEKVFTGPIEGLVPADRAIAAEWARLPKLANGPPPSAPQIARRMINQGVFVIANVLRQLGATIHRPLIDQMFTAAETLWVSDSAADSLAMLVEAGTVAHLATERDWSAKHHLLRAFASRNSGAAGWPNVLVSVDHTTEPFAEAVVDEAFAKLGEVLKAKDRATVKRRVTRDRRVTAFVVSPPRGDVVAKLRSELPELGIVFMSRVQRSTSGGVAIEAVVPAPTDQAEQTAENDNEDARASL